jgi:hypothetical protein
VSLGDLVQWKTIHTNVGPREITFDATPTPGNKLICGTSAHEVDTTVILTPNAGAGRNFTLASLGKMVIPPGTGSSSSSRGCMAIYHRNVVAGDSATINAGGDVEVGSTAVRLWVAEIEGPFGDELGADTDSTSTTVGFDCDAPCGSVDAGADPALAISLGGWSATGLSGASPTYTIDRGAIIGTGESSVGPPSRLAFEYLPTGGVVDPTLHVNAASGFNGSLGMLVVFAGPPEPPPPPPEPGSVITINDVEINDAFDKPIRVALQEAGTGQFRINRTSLEATATNLAQGNLVKVTIPRISADPIFAWFLETGDFDLVSSDEEGGEILSFAGRGARSLLARARMWDQSYLTDLVVVLGPGHRWLYTKSGSDLVSRVSTLFSSATIYTAGAVETLDWPDHGDKYIGRTYVPLTSGPHTGKYVHTSWLASPYAGEGDWKLWAFGDKPGQILYRIIAEAQAAGRPHASRGPLLAMTLDFDDTIDSNGDAWASSDATAEFTAQIGEDLDSICQRLIDTGDIDVVMDPDLVLHAYSAYGRDLTSPTFETDKVRFVKGVNIADLLTRSIAPELPATDILVDGDDQITATAELADADDRPTVETYVSLEGTDPAVLADAGAAILIQGVIRLESAIFKIAADMIDAGPEVGAYLPGPEGTNGHFWTGDSVTLDTGDTSIDYDEATERVMAVTIGEDEGANLTVEPELNAIQYDFRVPIDSAQGRGMLAGRVLGKATPTEDGTVTGVAVDPVELDLPKVKVTTTDPTTGDDSDDGYSVLSRWINVSTAEEFVATDVTVGAAVWVSTTDTGGSGSGTTLVVTLTNKSGASVAAGDVVVVSGATAVAFTTTTVARSGLPIGVAQATIANNASGPVAIAGYVALVNTGGASVALRDYAETNGTAKQAAANGSRRSGSFGVYLTAGTTPDAILFGSSDLAALSSATPLVDSGSGSAGSGTEASRDDHVHPASSGSGTLTTVEEADASPTDSAVTKIVFPNGSLAIASHIATVTFPSSSAPDPIFDNFGTPDTAFEFNANSFTGLTAQGTPDIESMHATIPGHLLLSDNDGEWVGRYASVTPAFTAIAKVTNAEISANYQWVTLFCGVATPGKMVHATVRFNGAVAAIVAKVTGPTDSSPSTPTVYAVPGTLHFPCYLAIKAVSSTDVTYYWSGDGFIWYPLLKSDNNSMTVASVGVSVAGFASTIASAAFDFLRIWNSSKTFNLIRA